MAASIVTISEIGSSGSRIQIKVNDGNPIPSDIATSGVKSFWIWSKNDDRMLVWTTALGIEMSMAVPQKYIGWVMSSMPSGVDGDRFRLYNPCTVEIESET